MRPDGNDRDPLRLLVSGGIGSGKSTVLEILQGEGVFVIEADRIGHEVLEPGGPAFESVSATWPAVVKNGRIDRGRLAAIVFTDPEALERLEAIAHPHIAAEIERRVAEAHERDIAVELPLRSDLVGSGWTRLVVETPMDLRLRRAVDRGMDESDAEARIEAQPDDVTWRAGADVVVDNTGSLEDLYEEVKRIWIEMKDR
ncbi:MAG: dephospho-CoA kinase [bacterium]|nr:dephospho-CoA kinase [bacterium]